MTRLTRIILALVAIFALAALPAAASKPASPGKSESAPHGKAKGHGVTKITSGATMLELDGATVTALTGAGFVVAPAAPATATGTTFSFPITKGRVHYANGKKHKLKGYVNHSGGITFTKGATSVTASDPRVLLSSGKKVRLFATIGSERVRLLDLNDIAVADGKITGNAVLSEAAAMKLNAAFAVTLFTPGLAMGKVTVTPGA